MWKIVVVLTIVVVLFKKFSLGAVRDFRDTSRTKKIFADLIENGLNGFDALYEVSRKRHPELSLGAHHKIATKFCDLDKFLGFMIYAVDVEYGKKAKLKDKEILALLETTTLIDKGNGVYTTNTDRNRYYKILTEY